MPMILSRRLFLVKRRMRLAGRDFGFCRSFGSGFHPDRAPADPTRIPR